MKMKTLRDLFIDELKDVYHAEKQVQKALPKMVKNAHSEQLKTAFEEHIQHTEDQIEQLEQVFKEIDMAPKGKRCLGMEGIIEEGKEMMEEEGEAAVMDAALISAAQKVEHYEIASYGTLRTYAEQLGFNKAAKILQNILDQESMTNEKLTQIAERDINQRAIQGSNEEE